MIVFTQTFVTASKLRAFLQTTDPPARGCGSVKTRLERQFSPRRVVEHDGRVGVVEEVITDHLATRFERS